MKIDSIYEKCLNTLNTDFQIPDFDTYTNCFQFSANINDKY